MNAAACEPAMTEPTEPSAAAPPPEQIPTKSTNGNKRVCRRKTSSKEGVTNKTANQIKSLRLKGTAARHANNTRIPPLPKKPCKAGTNVIVKGRILQEEPEGLLVMSIQWRGQEYCGCFIETSRQGWAPPRFDDPKVTSIAFLKHKAMLLNSEPDESTDDDYSPKSKRKKGRKVKRGKKRKVKNGDVSYGTKTVKTPTKIKPGRPLSIDKSKSEITEELLDPIITRKTSLSNGGSKPSTPIKDNIVKTEKTATIPVGIPSPPPARSSPKPTVQDRPTKSIVCTTRAIPLESPIIQVSSPVTPKPSPVAPVSTPPISPLHNSYGLMVPPPFFIPNFLQSAKLLAEGARRAHEGVEEGRRRQENVSPFRVSPTTTKPPSSLSLSSPSPARSLSSSPVIPQGKPPPPAPSEPISSVPDQP